MARLTGYIYTQMLTHRARGEQLARRIDQRWGNFNAFVSAAQSGDAVASELLTILTKAYHRHKAAEARAKL